MRKVKMLLAAVLAVLLCAAMFTGCGKKTDEVASVEIPAVTEYKQGYIGDPIDENGNQGEYIECLPDAFEQPAAEQLDDETFFHDDVQEETCTEEENGEDLSETEEP